MLVLTRRQDESILIGTDVLVSVHKIYGDGRVKLAISAPPHIQVNRFEVAVDKGLVHKSPRQHTPSQGVVEAEKMTEAQALAINSDMVHLNMVSMEVAELRPGVIEHLRKRSLAELLEATRICESIDKHAKPDADGVTRLHRPMICSDRLISAIYTGLHHEGSDATESSISSVVDVGDRGVFVIQVNKQEAEG